MKNKNDSIMFKSTASLPKQALILMFDLEGFSRFFSQPDVHTYVPKFINRIFHCMKVIIDGGIAYWMSEKTREKPPYDSLDKPVHTKFLGDGALYIWTYEQLKDIDIIPFLNRLWNLKLRFQAVLSKCSEDIPVVDLPKRIRFGLSAGSVYKLTYSNSTKTEYIGYCINLASRLQNYCRELGFIASARIPISEKEIKESGYIKVIAKNLKNFPKEIVIVDKAEYTILSPQRKKELFQEIKK